MSECRPVRHPVSPVLEYKKLTMLEQVQYRKKLTQYNIFWSRVLEENDGCWNADADGSFLDANAQQ
jgi:hypothetical protein